MSCFSLWAMMSWSTSSLTDQVTVWFQYRCFYVCFIRVTHNVLFESVGNGVMVYIVPLSDSMVPVQVFVCVFYKSYSQCLV